MMAKKLGLRSFTRSDAKQSVEDLAANVFNGGASVGNQSSIDVHVPDHSAVSVGVARYF